MDIETSLRVLTLLCDTLNTPVDIDETLERITGMTGVLMETRQTAILLRDDDRNELIVRTRAGIAAPGLQTGHPLAVNARLKHILLRMNSMRQIGTIESGIEGIGFPILVTPLRVKGERVGLLITGSLFPGRTSFDGLRRRLFSLIAAFSSALGGVMKDMMARLALPSSRASSILLIPVQLSRMSSGVGGFLPSPRVTPGPVRIAARL